MTGRNCIGFEISPKYFDIIEKRYSLATTGFIDEDSIAAGDEWKKYKPRKKIEQSA